MSPREPQSEPLAESAEVTRAIPATRVAERERLMQQELLLSIAGRMAHLGGWSIDLRTLEVEWSNEVCDIHGEPHGTRPSLSSGIHYYAPECRDTIRLAVEACATKGEPFDLQLELIPRQGNRRWVRAIGEPVRDAQGTIVRVQGAFQDVHDRVLLQEETTRLAQRLSSTLESITEAFYLLDRDWRFVFVNHEAERLVERRRDEILGMVVWDAFPEARDSEVHHVYQRAVESGEPQTLRFHFPPLNRWFDIRAFPSTEGLAVYFRDVTVERESELQLREQAALLEEAHDAILVRDLEHRVLSWNKGAERLYGWTADEVLGKSVAHLLYDDATVLYEATLVVLEADEWQGEIEHRTRDGRQVTVDARWSLLRDDRGRPARILAINTDITERKKLLAQFLRAQRMESIGTLAGGIAHDLNNVLAPVLLSIEMLRETITDADGRDTLSVIESSAQRGADMIRQLLGFARGFERRDQNINLAELVDDALRVVRDTFPRNIRLRRTIDGVSDIRGDPTQIHQVLINLLLNARDAMPAGGEIRIDARDVISDGTMTGSRQPPLGHSVCLSVVDTGTGMPVEVQSQIFDPFYTTKEVGKGTGLGLSTVSAIVRSHGGTIDVQSMPGHGTTFRLHFPALSSEARRQDLPPDAMMRGNGELVLVVDDEDAIRDVCRRTLERFGYRVLTAIHGGEAVSIYAARSRDIALVLTDMAMPVMDGPAAVAAIRAINPQARIIAASGLGPAGTGEAAMVPGTQRFLAKPFSTEKLLRVIREVLDSVPTPHAVTGPSTQ